MIPFSARLTLSQEFFVPSYFSRTKSFVWSDGQTSGGGQTKAESERGRAPLILHRESRKTMGFTW